jgi:hypothetical protein
MAASDLNILVSLLPSANADRQRVLWSVGTTAEPDYSF